MGRFNIRRARDYLQAFDFEKLFIEELGWNYPPQTRAEAVAYDGVTYMRRPVAALAGVMVFALTAKDGAMPDAKARAAIQREVAQHYYENLLIFVDEARTQSVWYWVKHEDGKRYARSHTYVKGQTGDLFLSKIAAMFVDLSDLDAEGNLPVVEAARRVRDAFDVERVTKQFYDEFQTVQQDFQRHIQGIPDEGDRRWYTSVILNRLMFIYFLQRKGFVDHDLAYLRTKLSAVQDTHGEDQYYVAFLKPLFFEGFAKPPAQRSPEARALLGDVRYLNGGLFLPHPIEATYGDAIAIPDVAFEDLFALFDRYAWHLDDTPGGQDDEINPAVLGYIFEKYINQKAFGAYYTRAEITAYLCEQTIHKLILDQVAEAHAPVPGLPAPPTFESVPELLMRLDANVCRLLLHDILPGLSLLDPACGSGAFLVAAMKTLEAVYQGVIGRIPFLKDAALNQWLAEVQREHPSLDYFIKKRIITDNLFGVDIMPEAVEIARLRLFLALVAAARTVDDLEPLPNIDFNVLPGNSLIGLLRVDETQYQGRLGEASYAMLVARKNAMVQQYRHAAQHPDLRGNAQAVAALRDRIEQHRASTNATLNRILLDRFKKLGIRYEQATWNAKRNRKGRAKKRELTLADIEALQPFHWGYEFHAVMNERGGFDAIITNPPWEVFQTYEKEFFQQYAPSIHKKKLRIEDWKKRRKELLADPDIRADWLAYVSRFPHQWSYFKQVEQYKHQITRIYGRRVGNKLNLYALFLEQCFNLLREDGECGIVIPSGIYTDLGTKRLRKMLFEKTRITGLFGFENRKGIFDGIHRSFKFVVLTFRKGDHTEMFPAAFMRHDVNELANFPQEGALYLSTDLVCKTNPDSLSINEFKTKQDLEIAEKLQNFPVLANSKRGWGLELYGEELNMTRSSKYFHTTPTEYPVYEGSMIWHFDPYYAEPRYWVDESELRQIFLEKHVRRIKGLRDIPSDLRNNYEVYRLAMRRVASNTNERTLISTVIPRYVFAGHSLGVNFPFWHNREEYSQLRWSNSELLVVVALLNSFITDYVVRMRMTTNLSTFYIYQLPVPRLTESDAAFAPIVERAAQLVCTTPAFDDLAQAVGLGDHTHGVTDPAQRARLRAELDGLIAHVYGLTEDEFRHILGTFPLVEEGVKAAALEAYSKKSV